MKCQFCSLENEIPMITTYNKENLVIDKFWEEHFYKHGAKNFNEVKDMAYKTIDLIKYGI